MFSHTAMMRGEQHCAYRATKSQSGWHSRAIAVMSKKYHIFPKIIRTAGGQFVQAFELGLVEFSCLGERRFDASGYPHASEMEALLGDWMTLEKDMLKASSKIQKESRTDNTINADKPDRPEKKR